MERLGSEVERLHVILQWLIPNSVRADHYKRLNKMCQAKSGYVYSKNNFEKKFNKKSQYDLGTTVLSNYCSSASFTTDLFPNSQSEDL